MPYSEPQKLALIERTRLLAAARQLVAERRTTAAIERAAWFCPDASSAKAYAHSLEPFRNEVINTLGWPLNELPTACAGEVRCEQIGADEYGRIYRVWVPSVSPMNAYGLFFLPPVSSSVAVSRHPLVIAQHGGHGAPELAAGFWTDEPSNYHGMIAGLRARVEQTPVAIFAPQLLVWDVGREPKFDQNLLDRDLRQLGGSRVALDLRMLRDALNWLVTHPEVDAARVGMAGLSYGGFYALCFAALEPRIRVVVSSCFVNDRYRYNWEDWVWTGSARRFLDGELGRMVCPRPLFLEAGEKDQVFEVSGFPSTAAEIGAAYKVLGLQDRFHARTHSGGHEFSPDDEALRFLLQWL